jgi:hypothetical protein
MAIESCMVKKERTVCVLLVIEERAEKVLHFLCGWTNREEDHEFDRIKDAEKVHEEKEDDVGRFWRLCVRENAGILDSVDENKREGEVKLIGRCFCVWQRLRRRVCEWWSLGSVWRWGVCGCNVKDGKIGVGLFKLLYHVTNKRKREDSEHIEGEEGRRRETQDKIKDYIVTDFVACSDYKYINM